MSNYIQPDYRIPLLDPKVGVQIENNRNPLGVTAPVPAVPYVQPDTTARSLTAGQLGTQRGTLGISKKTLPDGTVINL